MIASLALHPVASHASSGPLPATPLPNPTITVPLPVPPPVKVPSTPLPSVTVPSLPLPGASRSQPSSGAGASNSSPSATSGAFGSTYAGQAPGQSALAGVPAAAAPVQAQAAQSAPASARRSQDGGRGYSKRFLSRLLRGRLGCLQALPERQEEVLLLRTGIGAASSHSRRQVARMLHLSLSREAQIERRGVSAIRTGASQGCPALEPGAARALFAAAAATSQIVQLVPAALGSTAAPATPHRHRQQGKPGKQHQSVSAATTHVQQGAIPVPSHSSSSTLLWVLIAAGILAATALAAPVARRRARPRLASAPRASAGAGAAVAAAAAASTGSEATSQEDGALAAYRRADAAGDARGATNLGVLLEQQGDLEGALAAYRRADERGDVNGAFNLGLLLAEFGDTAGAMAALRRADVRGDPAAASNLGVLLERNGDLDGALAAYRRADERGDANGAFNLGLLLAGRGDHAGARAAYGRAAERDDPAVHDRARAALEELDGAAGS